MPILPSWLGRSVQTKVSRAESLGYSADFVAWPCEQPCLEKRCADAVMMASVLCACIFVALLVGGVTYLVQTIVAQLHWSHAGEPSKHQQTRACIPASRRDYSVAP